MYRYCDYASISKTYGSPEYKRQTHCCDRCYRQCQKLTEASVNDKIQRKIRLTWQAKRNW